MERTNQTPSPGAMRAADEIVARFALIQPRWMPIHGADCAKVAAEIIDAETRAPLRDFEGDAERLRKWLRRVDGFDRIKGPEALALLAALDCAEALHKWSRRWPAGEPPQDVTDQVSRALAAFRRAMEEKP